MTGGALIIQEVRGQDGKPLLLYHYTNPETEKEFVRRIREEGMTPEQAAKALCQCDQHWCLTHGARLRPGPRRTTPVTPQESGSAMMIGVRRDEHGENQTSYIFTRLDLVEECKRRVAGGMPIEQAYESMCQCREQNCQTHGLRVEPPMFICYE